MSDSNPLCKVHTGYHAIRKPKVECATCFSAWMAKNAKQTVKIPEPIPEVKVVKTRKPHITKPPEPIPTPVVTPIAEEKPKKTEVKKPRNKSDDEYRTFKQMIGKDLWQNATRYFETTLRIDVSRVEEMVNEKPKQFFNAFNKLKRVYVGLGERFIIELMLASIYYVETCDEKLSKNKE